MSYETLDKFGKFIVENLFDKGLDRYTSLANGKLKTPRLQEFQNELKKFDSEQIHIIKQLTIEVLTTTTHDFLFALQERSEIEEDITVNVDNENIAELSDGLHGEIFLEDGWLKRFSEFADELDDV